MAWISIESLTRIDSDFNLIEPLNIPASVGLYFTIKKVYRYLSVLIFLLLSTLGTFLLYEPLQKSENTQSNFYAWIVLLIVSLFYLRGNKFSSLLLGTILEQQSLEKQVEV